MKELEVKFTLLSQDTSEYYSSSGKGNITTYYGAELPHGWIIKSVFERIENEDNVVLHNESMVFVPKDKAYIVTRPYVNTSGGPK